MRGLYNISSNVLSASNRNCSWALILNVSYKINGKNISETSTSGNENASAKRLVPVLSQHMAYDLVE